jgi:hypothetical protein
MSLQLTPSGSVVGTKLDTISMPLRYDETKVIARLRAPETEYGGPRVGGPRIPPVVLSTGSFLCWKPQIMDRPQRSKAVDDPVPLLFQRWKILQLEPNAESLDASHRLTRTRKTLVRTGIVDSRWNESTRNRSDPPRPTGRYVRFEWVSPEVSEWWAARGFPSEPCMHFRNV